MSGYKEVIVENETVEWEPLLKDLPILPEKFNGNDDSENEIDTEATDNALGTLEPTQDPSEAQGTSTNTAIAAAVEMSAIDMNQNHHLMLNGVLQYDVSRPHERVAFGLNSLMGIPRHNLPLNISYQPSYFSNLRLLNSERYPGGWSGPLSANTDFSDARYWSTSCLSEEMAIQHALRPTLDHFEYYTGIRLDIRSLRCVKGGYMAAYDHIHRKFSTWCFDNLGFDHKWTRNGKIKHKLFKLERWYGTIYEYRFAPNMPINEGTWSADGRIIQNPRIGACRRCIETNRFCHGHRETKTNMCIPCIENKEPIICDKHMQRYV